MRQSIAVSITGYGSLLLSLYGQHPLLPLCGEGGVTICDVPEVWCARCRVSVVVLVCNMQGVCRCL